MASGKSRLAGTEGQPPSVEILSGVRRLLKEGSSRASRVDRACTGLADCCRFRLTGETPHVTLGEAWVVWLAWRAAGRTKVELPADGSCPFLNGQGRCMVYEGRPLACRTHFCPSAGGALPRREVIDLIRGLEDADVVLGGDGATRLPEAVERLARKGGGHAGRKPGSGRGRRHG